MAEPFYDVAIVGAGPAGVTAACHLSRAGLTCVLVDKATFPRDKSCGDAVCSRGVAMLRDLGVEAKVAARSHVLASSERFSNRRDREAELAIRPAYVLPRRVLDQVMLDHARAQPGVSVVEGFAFEDFVRVDGRVAGVKGSGAAFGARVVIGADGALSRVAERAGAYDFKNKRPEHWIGAFRTYWQGVADLRDSLEIFFLDSLLPGYLWVFPCGDGRANVGAGMVETALRGRRGRRGGLRETTNAILREHPRLGRRFARAREVEGSFRGWQIPCGSERRPIAGDGWMLVGDAAGVVDPFSGEGIGNAMETAKLAAEAAAAAVRAGDTSGAALADYEERVWAELGDELDLAYRLQRLARHKWLLDFVVGRAAARPGVRDALSAIVADGAKKRDLMNPVFYAKLLWT